MNILVTGGAGFIGSHLAERLIEHGHRVCVVDCLTDYYAPVLKQLNADELQSKGISFLPLDLAEDELSGATRDVDVIYHLAAQPGISASTPFEHYFRNNITATHCLLEAAKKSSALRLFVNISTSSIYGYDATGSETTEPKPTSYYGVTKLAAEQIILARARDQNFPACSLRLFSVYGARERPEKLFPQLIRCLLEDRELPLYEGSREHLRSFTYVGDIVDGLLSILDNMEACVGEIFNIGTDTAATTNEGIKIVEKIVGKSVKIAPQPKRAGDQLKTHANIEKAREILNYQPHTSLEEGLRREVDWYQQHVSKKINF